jgi:hypothetical protein
LRPERTHDREAAAGRQTEDQSSAGRSELVKLRVSAAERAAIEAGAARVQMTISAYLRALGTGYSPPSKVDIRAIHELALARADLGRLGGLLKLRLKDQDGQGAEARSIDQLLAEIERGVADLKATIRQL